MSVAYGDRNIVVPIRGVSAIPRASVATGEAATGGTRPRNRLDPMPESRFPWRPTGTVRRVARVAAVASLLAAACASGEPDPPEPVSADSLRGLAPPEPLPRPAEPLLDTAGEPYDIAAETEGKLAFVFFGYTYCPDVCPVHMAALAGALDHLGSEARRRTRVVFVTTDPDRDGPERIREWLDRWDRDFVGLRGTEEEVQAIQRSLNLPPSVKEPPGPDGSYMVGHAAQVVAFAPDGRTVYYPFGTRQSDWVHDIPILLGMDPGAGAAAGADAPPRAASR